MKLFVTVFLLIMTSVYAHKLKDVGSNEYKDFSVLNENDLVLFISANCSVCKRMIRQLDCLEDHKLYYIGIGSSNEGLRRASVKLALDSKLYEANLTTKSFFKLPDLSTPQLYIHKDDGKYVRGFVECSEIKELVRD